MRTCWWKQIRRGENMDEGSMGVSGVGLCVTDPWGGGGQGSVTSLGESCWLCLCGLGQDALRRWCKQSTCNAEDAVDVGSTPGSGRSSGGGNGNPLQYFCLENPMDRGAWQATIHGVAKSQTRLSYTEHKHLKFHSCCSIWQESQDSEGEKVDLELWGLAEAVGLLSRSGWEHMGSLWGTICHSLAFVHVIRKVEMLIHFFFPLAKC